MIKPLVLRICSIICINEYFKEAEISFSFPKCARYGTREKHRTKTRFSFILAPYLPKKKQGNKCWHNAKTFILHITSKTRLLWIQPYYSGVSSAVFTFSSPLRRRTFEQHGGRIEVYAYYVYFFTSFVRHDSLKPYIFI